jgi:O-methyltransferase
MVPPVRLANLYDVVERVNALGLFGDIVECGSWNGGSAAIMGVAGQDHPAGVTRSIWLFDSFEGLPRPDERDGSFERTYFYRGWCKADQEKVRRIFQALRIPIERLVIVPGWFETTLASAGVGPIAVLHVDADWYRSVRTVLEAFYDRVVPGGFIVFDDYGSWYGCRRAVHEFLSERGLDGSVPTPVAGSGAVWQKP